MIPIEINERNVIIKRYRIRSTGKHSATLETSIPKEAFEREARRQSMTVQEAVRKLAAVWHYDSFQGLLLTFEESQKAPSNLLVGSDKETKPTIKKSKPKA
jgi:hypothetical protein